ncbi:MAG: hypothetical protein U0414_10460 [Polyangiaceae bacterium]
MARRPFITALVAPLALLVIACSSNASGAGGGGGQGGHGGAAPTDPPDVADAIAACYATLHGDVSGRADALAKLEAATTNHPDNGRAHLFFGMCSLAALAEDGDLGALADIEPALSRAIELMPEDRRIPGWLATVRVQTARILGDTAKIEQATAEMIAAADLYPEFNNVSLAIAFAGFPLDTPYPAMAVKRLEAIASCGDVDEKCRDNAAAPHNVPGSSMLFGDVYARVGDKARASTFYSAALASPSAATWGLKDAAKASLDGLDQRVAAWTDADATNDPEFFLAGKRTCTACHQ